MLTEESRPRVLGIIDRDAAGKLFLADTARVSAERLTLLPVGDGVILFLCQVDENDIESLEELIRQIAS